MVLHILHATLAYSILENFRGLAEDEDKDNDLKIGPRGQGLSSRTTTLILALCLCISFIYSVLSLRGFLCWSAFTVSHIV